MKVNFHSEFFRLQHEDKFVMKKKRKTIRRDKNNCKASINGIYRNPYHKIHKLELVISYEKSMTSAEHFNLEI